MTSYEDVVNAYENYKKAMKEYKDSLCDNIRGMQSELELLPKETELYFEAQRRLRTIKEVVDGISVDGRYWDFFESPNEKDKMLEHMVVFDRLADPLYH